MKKRYFAAVCVRLSVRSEISPSALVPAAVVDGELKISGETYIFDHSGRMLTGWVNESDYTSTGRDDLSNSDVNALRYFRSGGQQMNGWRYMASPDDAEENWYYFKDGRAYSTSYKTTEACGYGMAKIKGET